MDGDKSAPSAHAFFRSRFGRFIAKPERGDFRVADFRQVFENDRYVRKLRDTETAYAASILS